MSIAATTYQWYLAVHILAAVVWVGGAVTIQIFAIRAVRADDGPRLATLTSEIEWVGTRLFIPSSLILVIMGFLLAGEGDWAWDFWLVFALIVWIASFVVGAGFLGPQSGKLSADIERHGIDSAQARGRLARILTVSRIELAFLVLVVLDMTLKPGT